MGPGRNSRVAGARVLDLSWSAREQLPRAPAKSGVGMGSILCGGALVQLSLCCSLVCVPPDPFP